MAQLAECCVHFSPQNLHSADQRALADRTKQRPNYEALAFGSQFGRMGNHIRLARQGVG